LQSIERQSLDCCSVITLPSMPEAARTEEQSVPPASIVAILPAREYVRTMARLFADGFAPAVSRWERPPRPGGELRTQLMVFLT
jgi:hypothetical protein